MAELKVERKYRLSAEGIRTVRFWNNIHEKKFIFNTSTILIAIGEAPRCNCGSRTTRHTAECASKYREMEFPGGARMTLSSNDIEEIL